MLILFHLILATHAKKIKTKNSPSKLRVTPPNTLYVLIKNHEIDTTMIPDTRLALRKSLTLSVGIRNWTPRTLLREENIVITDDIAIITNGTSILPTTWAANFPNIK